MNGLDLVDVRERLPSDENFIFSTWLRGLYYGNDWYGCIPRDIYFKNYWHVVSKILKRPQVFMKAACLKEDPEVILSYAIFEKNEHTILHWIFTKSAWRKFGIAKKLCEGEEVKEVSHLTKVGKNIRPQTWIFNPFLI